MENKKDCPDGCEGAEYGCDDGKGGKFCPDNISLCPPRGCMTHTVDGRCGKCGSGEGRDWQIVYKDEFGKLDKHLEMFISREIAAAEKRVHEQYKPLVALADRVRRIACCLGCNNYRRDNKQCIAKKEGKKCPIIELESALDKIKGAA